MKFIHRASLMSLIFAAYFANHYATPTASHPTTKHAEDVFQKWTNWQRVMTDANISELCNYVQDPNFLMALKTAYEKNAHVLTPLTSFLQRLSAGHINHYGYVLRSPCDEIFADNLRATYQSLDAGVENFLETLKSYDFLNTRNVQSESHVNAADNTIGKYNALFQVIFPQNEALDSERYLFSIANRFFEYCFCPPDRTSFKKLLINSSSYPLIRMMYSTIWLNLAGNGWKHWHENSLKALKEHADGGKNIIYIAGGSDIYQLVKSGIHNLTIIDPQLPSQPKYYTNDWEFVLYGKLGDKIIFKLPSDTITMERVECLITGAKFKARIATGEIIELPHSKTVWKLTNNAGKMVGTYTFLRRFCSQNDFDYDPKKTVLMSFNELYFITLPEEFNGWNIDISKINQDTPFIIKQLRKPINKDILTNMHIASLLNTTDLKFIALGSCIN